MKMGELKDRQNGPCEQVRLSFNDEQHAYLTDLQNCLADLSVRLARSEWECSELRGKLEFLRRKEAEHKKIIDELIVEIDGAKNA